MNVSKNVRIFAGPLPFVIRRPRRCAGCHPGPLSYHVSGSDGTEIMKEIIMTDSDMESVAFVPVLQGQNGRRKEEPTKLI